MVGPANELSRLHDRMPVIPDRKDFGWWPRPGGERQGPAAAPVVTYAGKLEIYPVSKRVNRPANNDRGACGRWRKK